MSSNIPQAREILTQSLDNGRYRRAIERALPLLVRSSPIRRAPIRSKKVTKELARRIIVCAKDHPRWSLSFIGRRFGVDGGRVSEVLNGKKP